MGVIPGSPRFAEIAQFEFSEDFAFEQRLCGVRDEYLPRLRRVAELGDAVGWRSELAAREARDTAGVDRRS